MKVLILGGAGFIGVNTARFFLQKGWDVSIFDNGTRRGCEYNLEDLKIHGSFEFVQQDIRDSAAVQKYVSQHSNADLILHLAAQVAVTSSVSDPRTDFEINALGTFNVLEAMRLQRSQALLIYSSTNKVYGELPHIPVIEGAQTYQYAPGFHGVSENEVLDFHSPYGCSKGAADQYVRDYARIYNLKTTVFRQSCIYGPHQYGMEDQGWLAWFTIASLTGRPITLFGDGKQVRDILYVDDLAEAFWSAYTQSEKIRGEIFNIGGGSSHKTSILEFFDLLSKKLGRPIPFAKAPWRPGDQKIFISNREKASRLLNWQPKTSVDEGVQRLVGWARENTHRFTNL